MTVVALSAAWQPHRLQEGDEMRGRRAVSRISTAVTAVLATAAGLTGFGPGTAVAAACRGWTVAGNPEPGVLHGVAVVPHSRRAWAAGTFSGNGGGRQGEVLHWNGSKWQLAGAMPSLDGASLNGVAAVSHSDAWAVGGYTGGPAYSLSRTLILHWNGTRWQRVGSPSPGRPSADSGLYGVAATSVSSAWAVGAEPSSAGQATLILHWNGTKWRRAPSPNPGTHGGELTAVAAVSAADAWAVGASASSSSSSRTLIEHWNGAAWKQVASPNPETGQDWQDHLYGVAAISATDAWAVGYARYTAGSSADVPIIEHWNGARWKLVPGSASPVDLDAVTGISARDAWAVGDAGTEHWNGKAWTRVSIPHALYPVVLYGVAASATNHLAMAVGGDFPAPGSILNAVTLERC
jgi:hypothetical protein